MELLGKQTGFCRPQSVGTIPCPRRVAGGGKMHECRHSGAPLTGRPGMTPMSLFSTLLMLGPDLGSVSIELRN